MADIEPVRQRQRLRVYVATTDHHDFILVAGLGQSPADPMLDLTRSR